MRETTRSNVALLIGSKEVHGKEATLESLRELLATIPRALATTLLCYIGSYWEGDNVEDWMKLDREWFQSFFLSRDTRRAVGRFATKDGHQVVVFTRRRAMTLLRLAQAVCTHTEGQEITDEMTTRGRYVIGEAFLQVGDLQEVRTKKELDDPLGLMVPIFEESNRPKFMLGYTRIYRMVRHDSWGHVPILIDATARFRAKFGLSISEYMYVIVGFLTKMMGRQERRPGMGNSGSPTRSRGRATATESGMWLKRSRLRSWTLPTR